MDKWKSKQKSHTENGSNRVKSFDNFENFRDFRGHTPFLEAFL